jgi:methionyl-tRNA formyltransferase
VETVRSGPGFDALRDAAPEILLVVAYGEILPPPVLGLPTAAPVNVHFSLLPQLRGAAPVQRAILAGLALTGVTTIRMDEGLDTGPILLQAEEAIGDDDDAGSLGDRLAALGGRLLVETVDGLEGGSIVERPQDETGATHAPKLTAGDRAIRWEETADRSVRRVRALSPVPGALTTFRDRALKVLRATRPPGPAPAGGRSEGHPGTVVSDEGGRLAVQAGDGIVVLEEVAPEGRRVMTGAEFVRGYKPAAGETLG